MSNQRNFSTVKPAFCIKQTVFQLVLAGLIAQPFALQAQIIPDQNSAYRPEVTRTARGIPVVEITAPTEAGVSRNQYQRFSTGVGGVILNNSDEDTRTRRGEMVLGNLNLENGAARVIVNEVTSTQASNLRGSIEVVGQKADVVLSNPSGITVNGGGFVNTSRTVLTTGTPVFGGSGSLDAFRVEKGQIEINRTLNAGSVEQLDLLARSVAINNTVNTNGALNVVTGVNEFNYADLARVRTEQSSENAPAVAIDVAKFGGMYANKIKLLATEQGAGVNIEGRVQARASTEIKSADKSDIKALNADIGGKTVTLNSGGAIRLDGTNASADTLTVQASEDVNITNRAWIFGLDSTVSAGKDLSIDKASSLQGGQTATVTSGGTIDLDQNVRVLGAQKLTMQAAGDINVNNHTLIGANYGFMVSAGKDLNISRSDVVSGGTESKLHAVQNVHIQDSRLMAGKNYGNKPIEVSAQLGSVQIKKATPPCFSFWCRR